MAENIPGLMMKWLRILGLVIYAVAYNAVMIPAFLLMVAFLGLPIWVTAIGIMAAAKDLF